MHFDTVLSFVGIDFHIISLIGLLVFLELCAVNSLVYILDRLKGCEVFTP